MRSRLHFCVFVTEYLYLIETRLSCFSGNKAESQEPHSVGAAATDDLMAAWVVASSSIDSGRFITYGNNLASAKM